MNLKKIKDFFKSKLEGQRGKKKEEKKNPLPVIKIGPNRKLIIALWSILIFSVLFGIYKNFTAVDTEIIHEKEVIEERLIDTNGIESFVKQFAYTYHSWGNTVIELMERKEKISTYLAENVMKLNTDSITTDCPTTAKVVEVDIWLVEERENGEYDVRYSIVQDLMEGDTVNVTESAYRVDVYVDDAGNMVITKNPTMCGRPEKSAYIPEEKMSDGSVDGNTVLEIEEFLSTFFSLYPKATEKELAYYVKTGELDVIQKDYVYNGLLGAAYHKEGEHIRVSVGVSYLDQTAKIEQTGQYELLLEKTDNWKIIDVK